MINVNIDLDKKTFNEVYYPYLEDQTRTQIFFGGSSSGKSYFAVAQRPTYDILKGGRNYLFCRNVAKSIGGSVFNEISKYIRENELSGLFKIKDYEITCVNGYQALFTGLDDPEKIKSITPKKGVITDIVVEEATETNKKAITQLRKRLRGLAGGIKKRIVLLFNPILQSHWIYKEYFKLWSDSDRVLKTDDLLIVKTTYKDNRFLEPDDIKDLEDETDKYTYEVYTLGNWGVLGDRIFTNWRVEDVLNSAAYRTFDIFRNGLDFGFSNNPTALNRMYYHRALKRLYITHEYHALKVTNDQIARDIKPIVGDDSVICDSAEPKSIQELNDHGINAVGAIKGKDSVLHGIQWLQQQEIIIDIQCQHTKNEYELYHWKEDKEGNKLNNPVDKFNHHIDDIRYAMEDEMIAQIMDIGEGGITESSSYEGII